jgi:hypothetical protein
MAVVGAPLHNTGFPVVLYFSKRKRTITGSAEKTPAKLKVFQQCRASLANCDTRTKYQLRRNKVRLHNQLEALLEEAHIKLSSLVSDLLGASARRMLKALADEKPILRP